MVSSSAAPSQRRAIIRPRFGYGLSQLLDFPHRLLFPPNAGVGTVRSLKIVPRYQVSLNDVLDGKHLPPLTLKDFEEYLVFVERSQENLYFICWFRDYEAQYTQWQQSISHLPEDKKPKSLPELTLSFSRAQATFLNNNSRFELNLPSDAVNEALDAAKHYRTPPPSVLQHIQQQVESMLHQSLMKYVGCACSNSGRRRGLFAIFVGALVIAIGLIPVLLSIYRGEPRGVRLAGLPAFWFGATTAIAGFHGICVVIFLFGDARQLFPYELARPILDPLPQIEPLNLPMPVTTPGSAGDSRAQSSVADTRNQAATSHPMSPGDSSTLDGTDEDRLNQKITVSSQYSADDKAIHEKSGSASARTSANEWEAFFPDTAGFIPSGYAPSISSSSYTSSSSTAYSSTDKGHQSNSNSGSPVTPLHFDFDQLPPPSPRRSWESSSEDRSRTTSSFTKHLPTRGVFCKMTKVFSPLITRAQWEIVIRSAILAVFVSVLFGGIMYALPYHHHK